MVRCDIICCVFLFRPQDFLVLTFYISLNASLLKIEMNLCYLILPPVLFLKCKKQPSRSVLQSCSALEITILEKYLWKSSFFTILHSGGLLYEYTWVRVCVCVCVCVCVNKLYIIYVYTYFYLKTHIYCCK